MTRKLTCMRCGKSFPVTSEDAGRRTLCIACGATLDVPDVIGVLPAWNRGQPVQPALREPSPPPVSAVARQPTIDEAADQHSGSRWPAVGIVVACSALVILGLIVIWQTLPRDRWEQENHQRLISLKDRADALVRQGRLADAHDAYSQIEQEVGPRDIRHPALRGALQQARGERERIYQLILERQRLSEIAAAHPAPAPVPRVERPAPPPSPPSSSPIPTSAPIPTPAPAPPTPPPALVIAPPIAPAPVTVEPPRAVAPKRPPIRQIAVQPPSDDVTDEEIGLAVERGARFLLAQFEGQRARQGSGDASHDAGVTALCVYALLQAGQSIHLEELNYRIKPLSEMLDHLRQMPIEGHKEVYALGIRATALSVHNRPTDRVQLRADVERLIRANRNGAYTYTADPAPRSGSRNGGGAWDNSNSQYGLLGVWSAAEVGVEVPPAYWNQVQGHWFETQLQTGEWGYVRRHSGGGTLPMTVAGIASLFVTHDYLDAVRFSGNVGRDPFSPPLAQGLAWLETGDNALQVRGQSGYTLYGIERVGLASGFKYFGRNDWYRVLARKVIDSQQRDGSWGSRAFRRGADSTDLVETAYSLLFLARGRHPILMNKLRFDGAWANRPRDVANLARFASRELERPLNWQVVTLERDWHDWLDSPILYIASHAPIKFKERDHKKLRAFVEAGGLIYTQADGRSDAFNRFVVELAATLFPDCEWRDLPQDHAIYTLNFQLKPRPPLRYITNGSRVLMLHSPEDIARHWQVRAERSQGSLFELGINVFIYGAGKTDLRNRLSSPYIPPVAGEPSTRVRLARLRYPLQWDPEPYAFTRFARWFQRQTGYGLEVTTVDLAALEPGSFPIAHLTGSARYTPTDAEVEAMRRYVEAGGTLVIDACGGSGEFADMVRKTIINRVFEGAMQVIADPTHPLLAGKADGMDLLPRPLLRPAADAAGGRGASPLHVLSPGKGKVIFSPLDLTTGLLGTNTWDVVGYRPGYAQSLMKNAILWTMDGAPENSNRAE